MHFATTLETISKRIRTLTQQIPTRDVLHQNYPLLIKSVPPCPQCHGMAETQEHFWTCNNTLINLYNITVNNINSIANVINTDYPKISTDNIVKAFYSTDTFKWLKKFNPGQQLQASGSFHLLCQHIIPLDLPNIFKRFYKTRKKITIPLTTFL